MSEKRQIILVLLFSTLILIPVATGATGAAEPQQCGTQQISNEINIDDTIPPSDTKYYLYNISDSTLTLDYSTNVKIYINILNYDKYNITREFGHDSALQQYGFIYEERDTFDTYMYVDDLAFSSTASSVTNINNDGKFIVMEEITGVGQGMKIEVAKPVIVARPGSGELRIFGIPDDRVCLFVSSGSDAAAGDISLRTTTSTPEPTPTATPVQQPETETPLPTPVTPQPESATELPTPVTPQPETETPVGIDASGGETPAEPTPTPNDQVVDVTQSSGEDGPGFGVIGAVAAVLAGGLLIGRWT